MKPCILGWNDNEHNTEGRCCCNCKNQLQLNKHPWNKSEFAKGSVTERIGYVCVAPEMMPNATFFETPHGMCECWEDIDNEQTRL